MSSAKYTRYLQVNEVMMMEYIINKKDTAPESDRNGYIYTKLKDGHYLIFSNAENEVEVSESDRKVRRKANADVATNNTINHLAVPTDRKCSVWYTFLDNNYEFNTPGNMGASLSESDVKVAEYAKYCETAVEGGTTFTELKPTVHVNNDSVRIYMVNGYDFSGMYGILLRLYVERKDGGMLDLCDFIFTKATGNKMLSFLPEPIIFGNNIYDRYIEINIPSVYDIWNDDSDPDEGEDTLRNILNIKEYSPLRVSMSSIDENDYDVKVITYGFSDLVKKNVLNDLVDCTFIRTSSINGAIPTEKLSSDNLGAYIGNCPDYPFLEFYGTWKDYPLNFETVLRFNKTIKLYDRSLMVSKTQYDVSKDYKPGYDFTRWVVVHEIRCCICRDDMILKEDRYSMSQIFERPKKAADERFYYRPVMFDMETAASANNMKVEYTMRLINVNDSVQFVKTASYSTTDVDRFYAKSCRLASTDMINYTVYNRIEESRQTITGRGNGVAKTKYVKVFYDSNDILLEEGPDSYYSGNSFTLTLSQVPKNYKFTIKKKSVSGAYDYMDLSDGYYKLIAKDSDNNDIIVEPTYSSNMNMLLGELEFHVNQSLISRLGEVDPSRRKMSIVSYNADNSVYSLYDFYYAF